MMSAVFIGGNHEPPTILGSVLFEALGVVVISLCGEARHPRCNSALSRLLAAVAFAVGGFTLVIKSISDLHGLDADGTALTTLIVTSLVAATVQWLRFRKHRGWRTWPSTQATVEFASDSVVRGRTPYYSVEIGYSFLVNGEYFANNYSEEFSTESAADAYAASIRGQKLYVRYNPANPDISRVDVAPISHPMSSIQEVK